MRKAHEVEPTRYMKRKEENCAIVCDSYCGPRFGYDIYISNNCNKKDSCFINNNGFIGYEYLPQYKFSLFMNIARPSCRNDFTVLDYEVYCIDFENRENINKFCKHSDMIWEYIETKDISEEALKQVDDDVELLNDFDAIPYVDSDIRLKISKLCFKNPSELLSDTQIVNQQYDTILREWFGDNKWKLLYRASEHGYTSQSFHEYCDDKGPTLIVIKSSKGWIFGGYTTQSWKVIHPNEFGGIY